MSQAFPAFQLLLLLCLTMIVGLPLSIWIFMRGQRDTGARWWFAAVACNAAAMVLVGWLQRFSATAAILFLIAPVLAIQSMRWELKHPTTPVGKLSLAFIAYAAFQYALDAAGLRLTAGFMVNLTLLNVVDVVLIVLIWRVSELHQSRGLKMVAVALGLQLIPNILRLLTALAQGGGTEAFSGSPTTNISVVLITIVASLHAVGYGGFVLEKLHQRQLDIKISEARATEKQQLAERHAQELEELIRQRDDMIVLNSRFSTMNKMALYNSAIVHEISQPMQALLSILDSMSLNPSANDAKRTERLKNAITMVTKMAGTLNSLRTLMGGQQPHVEPLKVDAVLDEILPILQTQAKRLKVTVERRTLGTENTWIIANAVLLQRVIFNLATNALEALESMGEPPTGTEKHLLLETRLHQDHATQYLVLSIQDNGPGWPAHLTLPPGVALRTTKDRGLGVGLSFSQMIIESWRGELHAGNKPPKQGHGAVVEAWIPVDESH